MQLVSGSCWVVARYDEIALGSLVCDLRPSIRYAIAMLKQAIGGKFLRPYFVVAMRWLDAYRGLVVASWTLQWMGGRFSGV